MKVNVARLERMTADPKDYPPGNLPEFAFAGRSNVGKSSFINSMAGRKKLAYTSSKPGKTRTVNFYQVEDLRFVDLPGYGYAAVSKKERDAWAPLINTYLETREELLEVFLLVDARHEPTKQDREMYRWMLEAGFSGLVIATKVDKVPSTRLSSHLKTIGKTLKVPEMEQIIPYSSETGKYRDEMWYILRDIVKHYEE